MELLLQLKKKLQAVISKLIILNRPVSPEPKKSISTENLAMMGGDAVPRPLRLVDPDGQMDALYVPEAEEIRVSPVVSRKGYLYFLEEKTSGWVKRWVVSEHSENFVFLAISICLIYQFCQPKSHLLRY